MYNQLTVLGNLTQDIETKTTPTGTTVATSSIATSYKYADKEEVCYINFTCFGKIGDIASQYLRKGSKVMLVGRLIFEQWVANGQKKSRHTLRVETLKMLDGRNSQTSPTSQNHTTQTANTAPKHQSTLVNDDDEIPF